jgi:hypothetical protein
MVGVGFHPLFTLCSPFVHPFPQANVRDSPFVL